jgi:hypothetical protein
MRVASFHPVMLAIVVLFADRLEVVIVIRAALLQCDAVMDERSDTHDSELAASLTERRGSEDARADALPPAPGEPTTV